MPNAPSIPESDGCHPSYLFCPVAWRSGGLLGYYVVDRYFGVYPWGTVVFVLLGAAAGFYEIVKILILDQRSKGD